MYFQNVRLLSLVLALVIGLLPCAALAADASEDPVAAGIRQLETIDTLAQMQQKRSNYAVNSTTNATTTDQAALAAHENARAQYEDYVAKMRAARLAAQQAYDALTSSQQAQISSDLAASLNDQLDTV